MRWMTLSLIALAALAGGGCSSAYYGTMESFGVHKRDILVDRVEEGREDQEAAKEQFRDALEAFNSVVEVQPSELQDVYSTLRDELDDCENRANAVSRRIESIDTVANDLFKEWEQELDQYTSDNLRQSSERSLADTKRRYGQLHSAMSRAEAKMEPVLEAFRDQVLYLKHNLNAQAVASLRGEVDNLELEIEGLIREMEAAIAEADAFISSMNAPGPAPAPDPG